MPNAIFDDMYKEAEVYILSDVFPNANVTFSDPTILDGIVTSAAIYTGSNISSADIKFPKKFFGDHVKGLTPISIVVKDTNHIIMRAFIIEENGILSDSEDTVTVRALDYKWYFAKCTRIRGKWFTSDGAIPAPFGSPNTTGSGKIKYEMFRGPVISVDGRAGYIQDQPCIFNEGGQPTCNTKTHDGMLSIFKYRKMNVVNGLQNIEQYNWDVQYWTFSSILAHIVYWWLDPYSGIFAKVQITNDSFAELSRLSEDDSIPMDLSIEDMNPLDAINEVVSNIPGRWIWYLTYDSNNINIHVKNLDGIAGPFKTITIGDKKKLATDPVNVASLNVTRNWEASSSFVIVRGGKLKFTTTVELQPVWEPKSVTSGEYPFTEATGVPFANVDEFNRWKEYITAQQNAKETSAPIIELFERAYRYYCIPQEGEFLGQALAAVTRDYGTSLSGRLKNMYSVIETQLGKMLAESVNIKRVYGPPEHVEFENPVIFAYDDYYDKSSVEVDEDGEPVVDLTRKIVYFESGYSFDLDTGLVIFEQPQHCRFYKSKEKEQDNTNKEGDTKDKKTTAKNMTDLPESMFNVDSGYNTLTQDEDSFYKLVSRRIFCTLSITLDLPYIVGDDVFGLYFSEGGNFARYVDFDGNDLRIHANAYYPVLANKKLTITTGAYTLAEQGTKAFAVNISGDASKLLYPCDRMSGYEVYPDNNDKLLLKKLDNMKLSMNKYDEDINANLGILDISYGLGDIIVAIENSMTENPDSGYYMLKDYIAQITHTLEGESSGYTTAIVCTNKVDFTPRDYDKVIGKVYRRPDPFKIYKDTGFLETQENE